jgi:hypothetical protein
LLIELDQKRDRMVPGDDEEEDNTSQKADKQEKEGYDPQDSDVEENE